MDDCPSVLNVHMDAVAGREKDLENQLRALVAPARSEPGCAVYELQRDPENPGKFMHFEKFRNYRKTQSDPVAVSRIIMWRAIE